MCAWGKLSRLLFAAFIILIPGLLVGCKSPPTAKDVVMTVLAANDNVNSFRVDVIGDTSIDVAGGPQPGKMTMLMNIAGETDAAARAMKLIGLVKADIPGLGQQDLPMAMYLLGDRLYVKIEVPGQGGQWVQSPLDAQMWQSQDHLARQIQFLRSAGEVILTDDETVDGINCYVLLVKPDVNAVTDWAMSQQQGIANLANLDPARSYKEFSIKQWIAKDTFLPVKADIGVSLEMMPDDAGAQAGDFEKVSMTMRTQLRFFDYNKPLNIVLPEAARQAPEMPVSPQTGR